MRSAESKIAHTKFVFLQSWDSRIWDAESLLVETSAEIRLGRLSHKRDEDINDSTPKAESP